jgi:hypothetical protein
MFAIGVILAILLAGFASGYAVREAVSRRRRADARRNRSLI